jgi:hypothetical protein
MVLFFFFFNKKKIEEIGVLQTFFLGLGWGFLVEFTSKGSAPERTFHSGGNGPTVLPFVTRGCQVPLHELSAAL